MNNLHINSPKPLTENYRILIKRCRKFTEHEFDSLPKALEYGLKNYKRQGFRIFRQTTYEWYEPLNVEVAKIAAM